jgi:hypothetical protein
MKKYAFALGALAAVAAFPASASANTDCSYASGSTVAVPVGPAVVYADTGNSGLTGQGAAAAGACADNLPTGPDLVGGAVEAGVGDPGEAYVVVDGDDANTGGAGQAGGYFGVSTFETGVKDTNCNGVDEGSGSNSGGCLTVRGVASVPVPLIICGNTSGKSFGTSSRDGCTAP